MNLKHKLLVASARMGDNCFSKSVIFLLEHSENDGAMGVIVNRKGEQTPCTCGQCPPAPFPIYFGGPCEMNSRITMLHGIPRIGKEANQIVSGLWFGSPKILAKIVNTIPQDDHRFKVVSGYAGWTPGQLEREIAAGGWHVVDATPDLILDGDPDDLWNAVCPNTTGIPNFSVN